MNMAAKERVTLTIDAEVLARIDQVADLREEARSVVVERILRNGIESEEKFLDIIADPVRGAIYRGLLESPELMHLIAKMAGEALTEAEVSRIKERAPGVLKAGKKVRAQRKERKRGRRKETRDES